MLSYNDKIHSHLTRPQHLVLPTDREILRNGVLLDREGPLHVRWAASEHCKHVHSMEATQVPI